MERREALRANSEVVSDGEPRSEALGRLEIRGTVAAGSATALLCMVTAVLPALLRSGSLAFSVAGDQPVIPSVIYFPFCVALLALGVLAARRLHGAPAPAALWIIAAAVPLVLSALYGDRVLSPFPVFEASEANLLYRTAAVAAPHLLGAGAAASAALFGLVVALWFARLPALTVVSDVRVPRFEPAAAVVAVVCAGLVVYLHDPFRLEGTKFDQLAFAPSVDAGLSLGFGVLAVGVPFGTAALRRFALLSSNAERALRADAVLLPCGAAGFAGCLVILAVSDSRVRLLIRSATFQPFLGLSVIWYGVLLGRLALALVASGVGFLIARPTSAESRRSRAWGISAAVMLMALAGAACVDHEAGAREEHAFRTTLPTLSP
jgi:hypothetical protein